MSEDTHGGEIVSTFSDKKTFEVQKRPQRLAVPDLWGFQNPEGLDGGRMIKNPLIGKGAALSEGCAFGFMILELIAQKGY
ncbi:hypothetical protein [Mongoliibacter ruber]|uniref:Uncharacterized protein n=1 Tax=Mongoliibacter ruber TaxID=1750599 RepID=A0A2T0WNW1_9BACT|nr:hypothetical protein [Mongoliibacter ruber]PRY88375.1 hypothetical protein CLW00_10426 [Mongoliibacter ruber]